MRTRSIAALGLLGFATTFTSIARADDEAPTYADRPDDDEEADRAIGVFFNPLGAAVGVYGGEVDVVVGRKVTLNLQGAIYRVGDTSGRGLGFGAQFFPFRSAFHGFYLYPQIAYAHASADVLGTSVSGDVLGFGGTAGWQWTWDYGFSLRIGGGVLWFADVASATSSDGSQVRLALDGARPVLDASLGWTF